MNVKHSSKNNAWMTPQWLLDDAKAVLGTIHLDPASSAQANTRVGAQQIFTEEDDGLSKSWIDLPYNVTIFLNPPGGLLNRRSLPALFWAKLMESRSAINHAIFLCFSIEALQNTQDKPTPSVCEFPICIPKKRIKFDHPSGEVKHSPTHANAIVYVPGILNRTELFCKVFEKHGCILNRNLYT